MTRTFPVTVYAARAATLTAPTSCAYGGKLTATVKVTDRTNYAKAPTAKAGVAVTLQRKAAGTSTWISVGTGKTDAYGKAVIAFTNTASGRMRAVITSAVPGRTITTTERPITSVSVVTWSSLPSTVRSGAMLTAAVYAKPYEKGATVRVQARAPRHHLVDHVHSGRGLEHRLRQAHRPPLYPRHLAGARPARRHHPAHQRVQPHPARERALTKSEPAASPRNALTCRGE